jgi:hypothetical protein
VETGSDFTRNSRLEFMTKFFWIAIWIGSVNVSFLTAPAFAANTHAPANPAAHVTTDYIDANISLDYPGFTGLSVDGLGKEHFPLVDIKPPAKPWRPVNAERKGSRVEYRSPGAASAEPPRWAIDVETNQILVESHWSAADPPEPLVVDIHNHSCYATLLGLMNQDGSVRLPAILHLPGQGSFRISSTSAGAASLGYATTRWGAGDAKIMMHAASKRNRFMAIG